MVEEVRAAGVNVDGTIVREKAEDIAHFLGIDGFKATGGWPHRFNTRHGLSCNTVSSEEKSADQDSVSICLSTLPAMISQYQPKNMFNADEGGLYIHLQPEKSLSIKVRRVKEAEKC